MIDKIELPHEGDGAYNESRITALVEYMVAQGTLVAWPVTFAQAWVNGNLKIFTRRDGEHIAGMLVVCLLTCPVTNHTHHLESFAPRAAPPASARTALPLYREAAGKSSRAHNTHR